MTEEVPSVRSVALGLWVRTGSRNETPAQAGVSHFLEHLLFKGTARYSAIEISERFDGLGASVNAATGKETTHLHARFLDEHTEEVFDLLAEMLLAPTYPDIDSERQVVLEEIAMYDDEPQDRVHDVLAEAVFGAHPLGRRVLGEAEVIASIPIPDIEAYRQRPLRGAGDRRRRRRSPRPRPHRRAGRSGWSTRRPRAGESAADDRARRATPRLCFHSKETEQYHICFGAPGLRRDDERRYPLAVLDAIFGGSTSSRLFREVREKRGLAYSVGSYNEQFTDQGLVATYVGTREDNVEEACSIIGTELARLRSEPVSEEELTRAKESVKGRLVLVLRVDRGADDADLARDPVRPADRKPRRDAGQGRRDRGRRSDRAGAPSSTAPTGSRPPAWAPTRTASARRWRRSARRWSRHDQGRRRRRRRQNGRRPSARRSRRPTDSS